MGFFSSITKSFKRIVKKAAPIFAKVAPFIPALSPFAPLIQGAVQAAAPGTRRDVGPPIRRPGGGPSTIPRQTLVRPTKLQSAIFTATGGRSLGPTPSTIPRISFGENREINAAIQLGQAALRRGPIAGPSIIQPGPAVFAGGLPMAIGPIISTIGRTLFGGGGRVAGGAAGGAVLGGAGGNLVLSSTGRILSVITASGARIGRKRAVAIAKFLGLNAGAAALGIGIVELAQMTVDETGRPRRRRGITARDFATTRRTMTKIKSMHAMLPTRGTSRRAPSHVRTAAITHG